MLLVGVDIGVDIGVVVSWRSSTKDEGKESLVLVKVN